MSDTANADTEREDLRLLRDSATAFAQKSLNPGRLRKLRNERREFDREIWTQFAELGWTGLMISEDAGGFGMGLDAAAAVLEPLGKQLFLEPLIGRSAAAG
jgi:alkylation response protein AidB-like acyl-CoA dehydrogenase